MTLAVLVSEYMVFFTRRDSVRWLLPVLAVTLAPMVAGPVPERESGARPLETLSILHARPDGHTMVR